MVNDTGIRGNACICVIAIRVTSYERQSPTNRLFVQELDQTNNSKQHGLELRITGLW